MMSRPILGSFIAASALLLLGSAYMLADDSAAGSIMLAAVAIGLLLLAVRMLGRSRRLG
jgi:hypothetical protein